jgi:hypothetical protein
MGGMWMLDWNGGSNTIENWKEEEKKKTHKRRKKMNACFSLGGYQYL